MAERTAKFAAGQTCSCGHCGKAPQAGEECYIANSADLTQAVKAKIQSIDAAEVVYEVLETKHGFKKGDTVRARQGYVN